jgi:hypothetical protein
MIFFSSLFLLFFLFKVSLVKVFILFLMMQYLGLHKGQCKIYKRMTRVVGATNKELVIMFNIFIVGKYHKVAVVGDEVVLQA